MRGSTPLARVLGLGSAKEGAHHWRVERITAVALIPLGLWLTLSLLALPDVRYATVVHFVGDGVNPALLLLTRASITWHSRLGVQVVVEDYVHTPALKSATLILLTFAHALLAVAGGIAVLRLALAG